MLTFPTRLIRRILVGTFLVGVMMSSSQAIVLSTGDVLSLNFDFTGQTPPPPYPEVRATFEMSSFDTGDQAKFEGFGDLNLITSIGSPITFGGTAAGTLTVDFGATQFLDGLFSFRITALQGPIDFTSIYAVASEVDYGKFIAQVTPTAAPLPTTLALLGIGLAGLGAAMRRMPG